jgi:hypothetical protein
MNDLYRTHAQVDSSLVGEQRTDLGRGQRTQGYATQGIDDNLRTAKGHYQVAYTDEAITTTASGVTRMMTLVDLHDLVLTGVESHRRNALRCRPHRPNG